MSPIPIPSFPRLAEILREAAEDLAASFAALCAVTGLLLVLLALRAMPPPPGETAASIVPRLVAMEEIELPVPEPFGRSAAPLRVE